MYSISLFFCRKGEVKMKRETEAILANLVELRETNEIVYVAHVVGHPLVILMILMGLLCSIGLLLVSFDFINTRSKLLPKIFLVQADVKNKVEKKGREKRQSFTHASYTLRW